jgi:hypothetical protein
VKFLARRGPAKCSRPAKPLLRLLLGISRIAARPFVRERVAVFAEGQHSQAGVPLRLGDLASLIPQSLELSAVFGDFFTKGWGGHLQAGECIFL